MKTAIELIVEERKEQIEKHKRTPDYDFQYNNLGQLADAASILCMKDADVGFFRGSPPIGWNVEIWDKMLSKSMMDRLIIAGALCAAEADRLKKIQSNIEILKENPSNNNHK